MEDFKEEVSDFERANTLLEYFPETGQLYWKPRDKSWFTLERIWKGWNTQFAGKLAGNKITCNGKLYWGIGLQVLGLGNTVAHRVIWLLQTGCWPENTIDHKDGNGLNNKWCNLREATSEENSKNLKLFTNNKSGHPGLWWDAGRNKWQVYITSGGERRALGRYRDFDEAVAVRKAAELEHGFHPNHGTDRPL